MTTAYTSLLGLALPVTGELSGTWGDTVNDYITQYLDASVAGTQTISGSQTAVTLSKTTNASLSQAGSGATGSSQYNVINCTGNPASMLTVTVPAASKTYVVVNATSTNQDVKIVGAGPTTGVTLVAGERAIIAWNGSDFIKVATSTADGVTTLSFGSTGLTPSTATSGAVTVAGTLVAANGGTGQSTYTTGDLLYATGSTALSKLGIGTNGQVLTSTGTAPQWSTLSGVAVTTFSAGTTGFTPSTATSGAVTLAGTLATTNGGTGLTSFTANGVVYASSTSALTTGSALTFDGTNFATTGTITSGGSYNFNTTSGRDILWGTGSYTYITGNPGTGVMAFGIANTEQMRLTSTGLGIGTSSPSTKLHVTGSVANGAVTYLNNTDTANGNGLFIRAGGSNAGKYALAVENAAASSLLVLEASGNLGIGTSSPAAKLTVLDTTANAATALVRLLGQNSYNLDIQSVTNGAGTVGNRYNFDIGSGGGEFSFSNSGGTRLTLDSSGNLLIGYTSNNLQSGTFGQTIYGSVPGLTFVGTEANARIYTLYETGGSFKLFDRNAGADRWTVDSSGNLGLGVTPSAWQSATRALNIGSLGSFITGRTNTPCTEVGSNAYRDNAANAWRYVASSGATLYEQNLFGDGTHKWFTAGTGTAGDLISFTQAMTLDASGNLGVGTTSPAYRLQVETPSATGNIVGYFRQGSGAVAGILSTTDLVGFGNGATSGETRIYADGASGLVTLRTNSTERFRIGPAGQIGLSGANYGTAGQVLTSNGSGSAPTWQNAGAGSSQWTTSGSDIYYTTGKVTIGTVSTSLQGAWVGTNSGGEVGFGFRNNATATNTAAALYLQAWTSDSTQAGRTKIAAIKDSTTFGTDLAFFTTTGTGGTTTEAMRINNAQQVGIGTSSPSTRLQVDATPTTGNVDALTIGNSSNNANDAVSLVWLLGGSRKATIQSIQPGNAATVLTFNTQIDGGTFGERARINNNGYFKASNSGSYNGGASENEFNNSASGSHILGLYNSNASPFGVSIRYTSAAPNASSNYFLLCSDNSANRLFIYSNGNVGNFNNSYGSISDIKLKENITDATPKLASLNQLRVVNYNLKGDSLKQIGLVAQEVEQVFPGLVESSPDRDAEGNDLGTTTKSVKYSVLVPMLLKAVQELTAMNDELRQRVAALEAK